MTISGLNLKYATFFWRTYEGFEIDLILKNVQTGAIKAVQITTSSKTKFSKAFDKYFPEEKITVTLENGYKYCL